MYRIIRKSAVSVFEVCTDEKRVGNTKGRLLHFIIFNDILIEDKSQFAKDQRGKKTGEISGCFSG